MAESNITTVSGTGIPVRGNDIDTDRIIPARYLRAVTFDGLGEHTFEDDRKQAAGAHPFDDPRFADAAILLVNNNFGSGSSREHAPQALQRWGIRAVVGQSFGEIFFGNSLTLGIPCMVLSADAVGQLQDAADADPSTAITVDLKAGAVSMADLSFASQMSEAVRESLVSGRWDALGELLGAPDETRKVHDGLPYVAGFSG
ncbi:MAG: 3-isopropylmalate dehydratase small subunit [Chloroflexota bacterium]|jgi:3-isopropylmalate/(R)-2-methylmalate dehydratase small subunit|nr:3-isopropylmalate dehydratase small subunit [Chloroflexota bacterium]MDP6507624.1 3-isopropylmalate dehydratase small subunit [Chloroflexota bacterium]MDP6757352.1 3-isopropylmalate dehydratase small subunit [Chloroflexota bacterium]